MNTKLTTCNINRISLSGFGYNKLIGYHNYLLSLLILSTVSFASITHSGVLDNSHTFSIVNSEMDSNQQNTNTPELQSILGKAGNNINMGGVNLEIPFINATPSPVRLDQAFQVSPTFTNSGLSTALNVLVDYYLSVDNVISNTDFYLGTGFVNIAPGASVVQTITVNPLEVVFGLTPGDYFVGVVIPSDDDRPIYPV